MLGGNSLAHTHHTDQSTHEPVLWIARTDRASFPAPASAVSQTRAFPRGLTLIAVAGAEPRRKPENELRAFEFVEPFGRDGGDLAAFRRHETGRASGSQRFCGHPAIGREGSVAVARHLEPVFTQEYNHRNALTTVDRQPRADFGPGISVEEANVDLRRRLCEMIKNRAIVDAVPTPGSSQANHRHSSRKTIENSALFRAEREPRMHRGPAIALEGARVSVEECRIRKTFRENGRPITHGDPREEPIADCTGEHAINAHSPRGGPIASNPAQRGEGRQMLAFRVAGISRLGDPVGPVSAITLSRSICETAGIVRPIIERWVKPSEPPLYGRELRTRHFLSAVRLAVDQDEYDGRRYGCMFFQRQSGERRLSQSGFNRVRPKLRARRSHDRRNSWSELRKCDVVG